eukprot:198336-Alexandrium_andersonii.AAC.1
MAGVGGRPRASRPRRVLAQSAALPIAAVGDAKTRSGVAFGTTIRPAEEGPPREALATMASASSRRA